MAATAAVGLAAATTRTGGATGATPGGTRSDGGTGDGGARDAGATPTSAVDAGGDDSGAEAGNDAAPLVCGPEEEPGIDGRCHGYAVVDPLPPPSRGGCGCHKEPGLASGPDPESVE